MHWEINGTSAEYGEKWMLLPLGAVSILMTALFWIVPKIKSNFSTGFKTPWALSSEEVWNKTQRLGGRLFYTGRTGDFGGMLFRGRKRAVCGNDGNRICDSFIIDTYCFSPNGQTTG